jgi:hypothetical protein
MVITYRTARKTSTADITVRIRTGRVFRDREGLVLSGPCLEGELIPERPLGETPLLIPANTPYCRVDIGEK